MLDRIAWTWTDIVISLCDICISQANCDYYSENMVHCELLSSMQNFSSSSNPQNFALTLSLFYTVEHVPVTIIFYPQLYDLFCYKYNFN